jgi:hypothetical protein
VIAAFFAFDGPLIKRVKVYREGSAAVSFFGARIR